MRSRGSSVFVAIVVSSACGEVTPSDIRKDRAIPPELAGDVTELVASHNRLALDLYRTFGGTDRNVVMSPHSIAVSLAMLDAGAGTTTRDELRRVLHLTLDEPRTHAAFGAMLDSLNIGRAGGQYELSSANALFTQSGHDVNPDYAAMLQDTYDAQVEGVNFGDAELARTHINDWVAQETDDRIPTLFEPGTITPQTVLALVNATLFAGAWDQEFDAALTKPREFHLASGETAMVDTMTCTDCRYDRVDLPGALLTRRYFNGRDISFIVVMPNETGTLAEVERALDADGLESALADPVHAFANDFTLPRFDVRTGLDLRPGLEAIGMPTAYTDRADFSGILPGLVLSQSVHAAMIHVDEHGAVAAAATGHSGVSSLSLFHIDRPFVFLIRDEVTHAILFIGRVADPRG